MPDIDPADILPDALLLVSCEGGAERFIFEKLLDEERLIISRKNIIGITRDRSAKQIQEHYLNFDYEKQLVILRILDSLKEKFVLDKNLYRDRFPVCSVYTRPEVEILTIINEGKYDDFNKNKSSMKPSLYCKQILKINDVKKLSFLETYWSIEDLVKSIVRYRQLHHREPGEHCLADLLNPAFR